MMTVRITSILVLIYCKFHLTNLKVGYLSKMQSQIDENLNPFYCKFNLPLCLVRFQLLNFLIKKSALDLQDAQHIPSMPLT